MTPAENMLLIAANSLHDAVRAAGKAKLPNARRLAQMSAELDDMASGAPPIVPVFRSTRAMQEAAE